MLINVGQIMQGLKKAESCPNFFLTVKVGLVEVYNDFTFGQCEIQTTFKGTLAVGDLLKLEGTAEGYNALNKSI